MVFLLVYLLAGECLFRLGLVFLKQSLTLQEY